MNVLSLLSSSRWVSGLLKGHQINLTINWLRHLGNAWKSKAKYSRREFLIQPIAGLIVAKYVTKNFTLDEVKCRCGTCGMDEMDSEFMKVLQSIRDELSVMMPVTSAVRCSSHNQKVSTTGPNGPHVPHEKHGGRAADIHIYGANALKLVEIAKRHGMTGIGIAQRGQKHKRFIHLDNHNPKEGFKGPRPHIWSY